jgi:hypothetical protein
MKKIFQIFILAIVLFTILPVASQAAYVIKGKTTKPISAENLAQIKANDTRLAEIKAIDKSEMSSSEKKILRKEVRTIKKKSSRLGGGVYISAGALILIIILIVIFV